MNLPEILYEDNHLIVLNKRPGDIVQADITQDKPLSDILCDYIRETYNKPGNVYVGVIHRLDRPTSGVVCFAKTSKALERMNDVFKNREVRKKYWAVVKNKPPKTEDRLENWMVRVPEKNKSFSYTEKRPNAKFAALTYRLIAELDNYYMLEIELHTGRHHQIRSQLSAIGCPIKGDLKYGADRANPDASIHLHARELSFIHPIKKEQITFIANPPKDAIWDACLKAVSQCQKLL